MRLFREIIIILAVILLCGCAARELEERAFAQAMELDLRGGKLAGGFGQTLVSGENVAEILQEYQNHMDKYLDLGHVKAIVFGEKLLADKEKCKTVLLELEQMPMISRNSRVFSYSYQGQESYLQELEKEGKNAGQYLCDCYENNPYLGGTKMRSLGEMLSALE